MGVNAVRKARCRVRITGVVQGIGYRPYLYRLATAEGLAGSVRNDGDGVELELEGVEGAVRTLVEALSELTPPQAVLADVEVRWIEPSGQDGFEILASPAGAGGTASIPPDLAVCDRCLAELFDPADRRYRYPFVNCTDCGPRYTLVESTPYDRPRTSMAAFEMCPDCQAEYEDPSSRRFHAQPNACPVCGPAVTLVDRDGAAVSEGEPVEAAVRRLGEGHILAVRGPGGFHLACDATDAAVVQRLRERKHRPHQPFAVMARDLDTARRLARIPGIAAGELLSPRRPILLLEPEADSPLAPQVCGASPRVGVMLPWTPLQHLLLAGPAAALVMTSGNLSGEPLICTNDRALAGLRGVADGSLLSDLRTVQRADDSVALAGDTGLVPVRRSRGWTPLPIPLAAAGPGVLAVGGDLKNAPCVTRGAHAYMGQHVGDLAHPDAVDLAASTIRHLRALSGAEPRVVVHDLHPDYQSTALARRIAEQEGIPTLAVQHHHAHALACLAEHGHRGPALALALDGAGYGDDGTTWGGELLWVDGLRMRRLGHLAPLALPGGDRAAREPWRMALAVLHEALGDGEPPGHLLASPDVDEERVRGVWQLLGRPGSFPVTSSCGRWFDAVASLLGVRQEVSYEGQAAVELEGIAAGAPTGRPGPFGLEADDEGSLIVDLLPWVRRWVRDRDRDVPALARAFHDTLAAALVEATLRAVEHTGVDDVALCGGAFVNALLAGQVARGLRGAGVRVRTHRSVPAGDGGLALGQAWAGVLAAHQR